MSRIYNTLVYVIGALNGCGITQSAQQPDNMYQRALRCEEAWHNYYIAPSTKHLLADAPWEVRRYLKDPDESVAQAMRAEAIQYIVQGQPDEQLSAYRLRVVEMLCEQDPLDTQLSEVHKLLGAHAYRFIARLHETEWGKKLGIPWVTAYQQSCINQEHIPLAIRYYLFNHYLEEGTRFNAKFARQAHDRAAAIPDKLFKTYAQALVAAMTTRKATPDYYRQRKTLREIAQTHPALPADPKCLDEHYCPEYYYAYNAKRTSCLADPQHIKAVVTNLEHIVWGAGKLFAYMKSSGRCTLQAYGADGYIEWAAPLDAVRTDVPCQLSTRVNASILYVPTDGPMIMGLNTMTGAITDGIRTLENDRLGKFIITPAQIAYQLYTTKALITNLHNHRSRYVHLPQAIHDYRTCTAIGDSIVYTPRQSTRIADLPVVELRPDGTSHTLTLKGAFSQPFCMTGTPKTLICGYPHTIQGFSRTTGELLWDVKLPPYDTAQSAIMSPIHEKLFVVAQRSLMAINTDASTPEKSIAWSTRHSTRIDHILLDQQQNVIYGAHRESWYPITTFDPQTGAQLQDLSSDIPCHLIGHQDGILYVQ